MKLKDVFRHPGRAVEHAVRSTRDAISKPICPHKKQAVYDALARAHTSVAASQAQVAVLSNQVQVLKRQINRQVSVNAALIETLHSKREDLDQVRQQEETIRDHIASTQLQINASRVRMTILRARANAGPALQATLANLDSVEKTLAEQLGAINEVFIAIRDSGAIIS